MGRADRRRPGSACGARVEHYAAFMRATNRDERPYLDIAESLKKKGQAKEEQERPGKRKRA